MGKEVKLTDQARPRFICTSTSHRPEFRTNLSSASQDGGNEGLHFHGCRVLGRIRRLDGRQLSAGVRYLYRLPHHHLRNSAASSQSRGLQARRRALRVERAPRRVQHHGRVLRAAVDVERHPREGRALRSLHHRLRMAHAVGDVLLLQQGARAHRHPLRRVEEAASALPPLLPPRRDAPLLLGCLGRQGRVRGWFAAMNLVVHSVMYSYFAICALKIRLPNACRPFITTLQILQMFGGLGVVIHNALYCDTHRRNIYFGFAMYLSYVFLLCKFFVDSYLRSSADKKAAHAKKTAEASKQRKTKKAE